MRSTLVFFVKFGAVLSDIVLVPINTAVMAGEKMNINCLTTHDSEVRKWTVYNSSRTTSIVWSSGRLHGHFRHFNVEINANGPVKISANSTRSSDAGIYTCHCEIDGKDAEYSAHLIVLESLPVCESNLTKTISYNLIDGDQIWIQCNINFRGFWAPSMEWIQHGPDFGTEGKSVTDGIEEVHSPSQSVTSRLTIAVNSSTNGFYYSCKIYFANFSNTEVTTADNVPNFTYTWNSSVIYESHSSTQSVSAVTATTNATLSSVNWYLVSLAALFIFFILVVALGIVRYIRLKKKVSALAVSPANIPDVAYGQQEIPSDPHYAEVPRIERAAAKSEERTPGSSVPESHDAKNSWPMNNYFGADGTEYMEVNPMGRQPMPVRLPTKPSIFSAVGEYASIDHTLSPPIPPRGKNV